MKTELEKFNGAHGSFISFINHIYIRNQTTLELIGLFINKKTRYREAVLNNLVAFAEFAQKGIERKKKRQTY